MHLNPRNNSNLHQPQNFLFDDLKPEIDVTYVSSNSHT